MLPWERRLYSHKSVIQGAARIQVIDTDGATYLAEMLADAARDLAVLKICSFQTAQFGDVAHLEPATEVLVIGYPHSMSGPATITKGIVSAIRFNATLGPGKTDAEGIAAGLLITLKYKDAEGIGFAVPRDVIVGQSGRRSRLWSQLPAPMLTTTFPGGDSGTNANCRPTPNWQPNGWDGFRRPSGIRPFVDMLVYNRFMAADPYNSEPAHRTAPLEYIDDPL